MPYHIIEERKFDRDGNYVPPPGFYVVNEVGKKVSERCDSKEEAMRKLLELEAKDKDKLETEKSRDKDTGRGR